MPPPVKSLFALTSLAIFETLVALFFWTLITVVTIILSVTIICLFPLNDPNLPSGYWPSLFTILGVALPTTLQIYGAFYLIMAPIYVCVAVFVRNKKQQRLAEEPQSEVVGEDPGRVVEGNTAKDKQGDDYEVIAERLGMRFD